MVCVLGAKTNLKGNLLNETTYGCARLDDRPFQSWADCSFEYTHEQQEICDFAERQNVVRARRGQKLKLGPRNRNAIDTTPSALDAITPEELLNSRRRKTSKKGGKHHTQTLPLPTPPLRNNNNKRRLLLWMLFYVKCNSSPTKY